MPQRHFALLLGLEAGPASWTGIAIARLKLHAVTRRADLFADCKIAVAVAPRGTM